MRAIVAFAGFLLVAALVGALYTVVNTRNAREAGRQNDTINSSTTVPIMLTLSSSEFMSGQPIPSRFTCDSENVSPPIAWSGAPEGTKSFVLIVDDPDVPKQLKPDGIFDHWVLFNIPPTTSEIAASSTVGVTGANGAGANEYIGPCPPSQYEPSEHRYFFRLYALDALLPLQEGATKEDVLAAIEGHVLARAELLGTYKRQ